MALNYKPLWIQLAKKGLKKTDVIAMAGLTTNVMAQMGKVCYNYCRKKAGVGVLKTLVTAIGAGLGAWGVINLMEGYGNDNPGANAHVR